MSACIFVHILAVELKMPLNSKMYDQSTNAKYERCESSSYIYVSCITRRKELYIINIYAMPF